MPYDWWHEERFEEVNVDSVIIPGGCIKYIQAFDVCWNKPIKARMTRLYDQWLSEVVHQFTEGWNMKPPSRKRIIEWVLDAWSQLSKENITKLFKCCGLKLTNDGMEDGFIHRWKKRQTCKAGRQKLNSRLSILVNKSDAVSPFISPSDEVNASKKWMWWKMKQIKRL